MVLCFPTLKEAFEPYDSACLPNPKEVLPEFYAGEFSLRASPSLASDGDRVELTGFCEPADFALMQVCKTSLIAKVLKRLCPAM